MSECGKKTSGPFGLGVSTCVRASWHDGECRPWLTSDERDEAELATLRADLARVTTAQTHTGVTADSRETICGLPRAPAFLEVPASDGVTCIACLQGVGRLYGENAFRNLNDAIANRERAERAEADLARVTGELDGLADGLTIANNAAERRGRERDAACAQVRELQKVARAAVYVVECGERLDVAAVAEAVGILRVHVDALPPSMLEEVSNG